ncbi:MAG: peptidoglycan DD-metalloendopeptidase family protein [Magnetococcales bacterium]|nr:peptidoglycan DD-metalloendopeptidase family protein [Magnetococcales bacterium]
MLVSRKNRLPLLSDSALLTESSLLSQRTIRYIRLRRFLYLLLAMGLLTLVAVQQVSDASTRNHQTASDYLTWLLRGDESQNSLKTERAVPGAPLLASLPRTLNSGEESASLRMDFGMTRAVIEQVQSGDTIFSVLHRHGVVRPLALAAAREGKAVAKRNKVYHLTRAFRLGRLLKLTYDSANHLAAMQYPLDNTRTLHVLRKEDGSFGSEVRRVPLGVRAKESAEEAEASVVTRPLPPPAPPQNMPLAVRDLFSGAARQIRDTVRSGDLLTTLLARHGINQTTAYQVATASRPVFNLAKMIKAGQDVRLAMDEQGELIGLSYSMNPDSLLWVMRRANGTAFKAHVQKKQLDVQVKHIAGTIGEDGSLFLAGKKAGLAQSMVVKLANLFEWDLDFTRDIHAGDQFRVVFESKYFQGKRERDGEIVAAEFVNQGRVLQVFRYTDPSGNAGYFDAKGQSIRKIFIRTPVDFTRITSLFSKHRKHPIYGFTRAHKGVDYAAPQGTPVRASGDGRVTFIGRKGDYGQMITVRHNDTYSTAYAHLSAFNRNLRVGSPVKQGDVIGRVGTTGASTGPHLHYEVRVHDEPVNPLSIQQIMANPVSARFAEDFRQHSKRAIALLHSPSAPQVAAVFPKADELDD